MRHGHRRSRASADPRVPRSWLCARRVQTDETSAPGTSGCDDGKHATPSAAKKAKVVQKSVFQSARPVDLREGVDSSTWEWDIPLFGHEAAPVEGKTMVTPHFVKAPYGGWVFDHFNYVLVQARTAEKTELLDPHIVTCKHCSERGAFTSYKASFSGGRPAGSTICRITFPRPTRSASLQPMQRRRPANRAS